MTVPKHHSQTSSSSAGDTALISPVSSNSTSNSSHPSTSTQSHGSQKPTATAERLPPPKTRSSAGPGQTNTRFTLRRKDKDKDKLKPIPGGEGDEEEWTLEGTTTATTTTADKGRHGHDVLISPPSREDLRATPTHMEEPASLLDSQLTEVPNKDPDKKDKEKKSRGRGLVKKTSKLFLRGDRDKGDTSSSASLAPKIAERQQSYSSATSNDSAVTSASSSNNSIQLASVTRAPPTTNHSRRLSHDSQFSWTGAQSVRSSTSAAQGQPTGLETRRMSNGLSASVPALSRNSLPQPGQNPRNGQETIPSRMSSWFTNLLPSSSSATIFESQSTQDQQPSSSSPARKGPSAAASFLYAARQKAVDGVRNLLDSEAQPDKSPDTIWLMGVGHPGYRPSSPFDSPSSSTTELPVEGHAKRRGSSSSGKSMNVVSPSFKSDQAALRPAVWPKRNHPTQATSPAAKGIGNLFSPSSLSLALPTGSSPQKDANQLDSPGKGKKKEREILKWPEQFHADFRSRVWCTYRSQYAPIVSLSNDLLIPTPKAYYSAFASPGDISSPLPLSTSIGSTSLPNRPSTSAWGWTRNGEERGLTSDAGWGCMLRTGQSMLANALVHLHLGRDWRMPLVPPEDPDQLEDFATHVRILSWFFDDPSPLCPFSVHRMALIGKELGKEVGEWFGPSTAAGALKTLANSFPPCGISVVSATDSMIYKSDVYSASSLSSRGWFDGDDENGSGVGSKRSSSERGRVWGDKAVLVLVGLRLGLDGVNPIYYDSIKALFTFPQSVGIAGGRPSSSYYFIGTQGDSLFYLDPHFTRPAVPLKTPPAPSTRSPPTPHWRRSTTNQKLDADDSVVITPDSEQMEVIKPLTTYTLDEVDVDELSDDSSATSSPTNRLRRSTIRAVNIDTTRRTPPASPTRTSKTPDSPTTPLAPSPSRPSVEESAVDLDPTPLAPQRTRSRSTVDSTSGTGAGHSSSNWFASAYTEAQLRSFHCDKIKKIPLSNVDPSMLLGFLCKNEADFEDFCERVSKMPRKIFTVQDEPPTWDDNDDPGMESVSDASSGGRTNLSRSTSHESAQEAGTETEEQETLREVDDDEYTTTTLNAIEIESDAQRLAALKMPAIARALVIEEDGETVETVKPRPPKPRPLQSMGPVGTDSWIRPGTGGEAAPNGKSVI